VFLVETWTGRFDRTQDLVTTTIDHTGDKVCDYLEWPMEQMEFLKTVSIVTQFS